jgi:hypothetical protein
MIVVHATRRGRATMAVLVRCLFGWFEAPTRRGHQMTYSVHYGTSTTVLAARGLTANLARKRAASLLAGGRPNVRIVDDLGEELMVSEPGVAARVPHKIAK